MIALTLMVTNLGGLTNLPAPEINEPDGIFRRTITFRSMEEDLLKRDEIHAVLWDTDALLDIHEGDEVSVTLQFRVYHTPDGSCHQIADVVKIRKSIFYN